jgi:predicted acyltransferase
MVPVNIAAGFAATPGWFRHAPASGLTLADVVLPVFLFSLGLSAAFSFQRRREAQGLGRTFLHSLARNALLFAFGTAGILLVDRAATWEILQMLGATGMLSFFFLLLRPLPRLVAACLLLAGVEALRPLGLGALMRGWWDSGIAGPWGTFSLGFLVVASSALGELVKEGGPARKLAAAGLSAATLCAAGAAALLISPLSKHELSLSYILLTGGIAAGLLALVVLWTEVLGLRTPILGSIGRNPLILYMLHAVLGVAAVAVGGEAAPAWLAWSSSAAVLLVCVAAALILDRRMIYLKL